MDAVVKPFIKSANDLTPKAPVLRPSREEAEEAVRTLLRWAGEDPAREGLLDTPKRVTKAYGEFFGGYNEDPAEILDKVFEEVAGYDDMVLVNINHYKQLDESQLATKARWSPFAGMNLTGFPYFVYTNNILFDVTIL